MDDTLSLLIPMVLAVCVVVSIKIVMEARLRRRLSETHASDELVRAIFEADEKSRHLATLKWGLVLVLMGAAFGLIQLFRLRAEDPAAIGLLFAAAGVALIGFYAMNRPRPIE